MKTISSMFNVHTTFFIRTNPHTVYRLIIYGYFPTAIRTSFFSCSRLRNDDEWSKIIKKIWMEENQ